MARAPSVGQVAPRIIGAEAVGVTKKVADQVVRDVRRQLSLGDAAVRVKTIRFIPSSRTMTADGSYQVVANAVVETPARSGALSGREGVAAFDSVITVGRAGRTQKLERLTIPALQRGAG